MRISKEQLQKIVAEEVQAHFKKSLINESRRKIRTVKATPKMLRRIIAEEMDRAGSDIASQYPTWFNEDTLNLVRQRLEKWKHDGFDGSKETADHDAAIRRIYYPNVASNYKMSDDHKRPTYIIDENFLDGEAGGIIKEYETVDWRTGEKKLVKSNRLDPQFHSHQLAMYYLQNNDLRDYKYFRGFINNCSLVHRESISTDFFVGDLNNPLIVNDTRKG
jgi:hypothetical protein